MNLTRRMDLLDSQTTNAAIVFQSNLLANINSPQLFANQAAAVSFLSKCYSRPSFFNWQLPISTASPPISPVSMALSVKSAKKINTNNTIVSNSTNKELTNNKNYKLNAHDDLKDHYHDELLKASKTVNFERKGQQILYEPYTNLETLSSKPGRHCTTSPVSLSPPTSSSSPHSIDSMEYQSPSSSPSKHATPNKQPTITRVKTFTCQTCNQSFGYKHVLRNHERTHTGEKPYACGICSRRFTRDHHLKTHMRLHTGEKPYHCDQCDQQFVQVANLRRHLRVHTSKEYACDKCRTKFSDSNQLKAHMIIHLDEQPFRCERCNVTFRRSYHLANHKCTSTNLLTPAMSPVMSFDNKPNTSRTDASQYDLLDLSKQSISIFKFYEPIAKENTTKNYSDAQDMPLDLSEKRSK